MIIPETGAFDRKPRPLVDRHRIGSGSMDGVDYGKPLDQYAPDALKPLTHLPCDIVKAGIRLNRPGITDGSQDARQ